MQWAALSVADSAQASRPFRVPLILGNEPYAKPYGAAIGTLRPLEGSVIVLDGSVARNSQRIALRARCWTTSRRLARRARTESPERRLYARSCITRRNRRRTGLTHAQRGVRRPQRARQVQPRVRRHTGSGIPSQARNSCGSTGAAISVGSSLGSRPHRRRRLVRARHRHPG